MPRMKNRINPIKKMKNIDLSTSYTTRKKRVNEKEGKDYFFVSLKKFRELKNATGVVTRLNQQQAELLLLTPQSNESPESLLKNENQQLKNHNLFLIDTYQ